MGRADEDSSSAATTTNHCDQSDSDEGLHYLAKCVLKGSSVLQAVHGHLRSPSSFDVVFGKETSLELVVVGDDGVVQSVCEQTVFGTIKDLAILRWSEQFCELNQQKLGKDLLVVLSDSGKLSFLMFCNEMHRFFPLSHIQLSNPGNSRHQLGRMLAVDSLGCFVAVSAYEERVALLSVSMSAGSNIVDKRIFYPPEREGESDSITQDVQRTGIYGTIWSMCFISKDVHRLSKDKSKAILAIVLNRRGAVLNDLMLLEWDVGEHTVYIISQYIEAGPLALNIIEVPYVYGFAILFRVGDALLIDLRDPCNPRRVHRTILSLSRPTVEDEQSCKGLDDTDVASALLRDPCNHRRGYRTILNLSRPTVEDEQSCKGLDDADVASALLELKDSRETMKEDDPMSIDSEGGNTRSVSKLMCSCSWDPGNTSNPTMIVSLDTGELVMLEISSHRDGIMMNLSECLYKCLPCKTLSWVRGGLIAALVEMGDGMVLEFDKGRLCYRSLIQNIAPILDMSIVDCHDEKQDQIFACSGVSPEGSLRIIHSGITVEKLLKTAPIYHGITGTWTLRMKILDPFHSFLVLSFVEETRVLSVGLSFSDVTDAVGFHSDASTLACGLVCDGLVVQIHMTAVRLCLPTTVAHPEGIPLSAPICTSWVPDVNISLGAVGHNMIVIATSNPCFLFILGVRSLSAYHYEIYEMHHVRLQSEISCISIPQRSFKHKSPTSIINLPDNTPRASLPIGVEIGNTFAIGTHKPSVEILSFVPEEGLKFIACGIISLINSSGAAVSGCIPQDVRLVLVDRFYILTGLRNGMLLRFEWHPVSTVYPSELPNQAPYMSSYISNKVASLSPSVSACQQHITINYPEMAEKSGPVHLQLIAMRRIGVTPVFLVPLCDSLDSDVIALSDRPWLLQTARHSLSYTSISFQSATHVTPVCSVDCPKGILFVAENSLHLVEMVHTKRLNVQKFFLGGTPRKVLYHSDSKLLLVMRTDLSSYPSSSDICCVDPLSGSLLSSYKLEPGETGKSMQLVKVGNEQVLVVGTSQSPGRAVMPSGEAESARGRVLVLCLEHIQISDSSSLVSSRMAPSSQITSPLREIVGYATEQLSTSSLCSSPEDNNCDGVKLEEAEAWHFRLAYQITLHGIVHAVCPLLDRYFLASAGNILYLYGFLNENPQRVRKYCVTRTRFTITSLATQFRQICVGDCRDGVLFYHTYEDGQGMVLHRSDPVQRLVADCTLKDMDTAFVSDRRGTITVLSSPKYVEDNASPERNLVLNCSYYLGETAMSIRKGSYSYRFPADTVLKGCNGADTILGSSQSSFVASTMLGSVMVFIPLSREEYELLQAVQARLAIHPLTAPILGNDHKEFRGRGSPAGVSQMLDGDMLGQFLELTSMQQEAVLSVPLALSETRTSSSMPSTQESIPVNKVLQLLERVHHALS